MLVEFISIGDELLIGQTVNTNASWLGEKFSTLGASIHRIVTIRDTESAIHLAIDEALKTADVVIITGGLGPTKDDVTKKVITNYFNDELVIDTDTLERVKQIFSRTNRPMLDVNIQQAAVPSKCTVLTNRQGTAPGMWLEKDGKIVISLPGVPFEMKGIMEQEVFPRLQARFSDLKFFSITANIQGIGESYLADKMSDWENRLRAAGFELAYLPSPGIIRLRITSRNGVQDEQQILAYFKEVEAAYPDNFFGYGDISLAEVVGNLLKEGNYTLSTAESCTGGAIGAAIVSVPGSSAYFQGGFLTYSNELKHQELGVSQQLFETVGAVSEEVVIAMAKGCQQRLKTDFAIAVSGIAGPDGGTDEKPVGTVWVAIATPNEIVTKKLLLSDNRERIINRTVLTALNLLRTTLMNLK
ncbi:MAG TPA: competence/damage-inducible protein A [Taishania sp.]|nr:competence/damage-inducible protein A [Taishania sp.]